MLILKENHPERMKLEKLTDVITPELAERADIRAIRLGILNLMPLMAETERDILQGIGHSVLQIEPVWIKIATRKKQGTNTPLAHIDNFYLTMEEATQKANLDGLIMTGAPIELLDFKDVDYWKEMQAMFDYAKRHVHSSLFLCWAAMAAAHHYYGVDKTRYGSKLAGIFAMKNCQEDGHQITRGMNPLVRTCQSRYTGVDQKRLGALEKEGQIVKLFESPEKPLALNGEKIGITAFASNDLGLVFNLGHLEYESETIDREVKRDMPKGKIYPVEHYYSDPTRRQGIRPITWKSDRTLFYRNFINLIYHQMNQTKKEHQPFLL